MIMRRAGRGKRRGSSVTSFPASLPCAYMPLCACLVLDEDGSASRRRDRSAGCGALPARHNVRLLRAAATFTVTAGLSAGAIADQLGHARLHLARRLTRIEGCRHRGRRALERSHSESNLSSRGSPRQNRPYTSIKPGTNHGGLEWLRRSRSQ
jgi:hypothetical protein